MKTHPHVLYFQSIFRFEESQSFVMNICRKFPFSKLVIKTKYSFMMEEFCNRSFRRFSSTTSIKSRNLAEEKAGLVEALPGIIEDLSKHPQYAELPLSKNWMKKVLNGNVTGGKLSRGLTTVISYKTVEKPENLTEETIRQAQVLGWCTELAYCVVLDDIADGSQTRRGQPCWYRREDVGIANAVNDASLIYNCLHQILQRNFEHMPIYVKLFQAFNDTLFHTSVGQFLDIRGSESKNKYELFTRENYEAIIKHKTAYYTYKLPISVGLLLANHLQGETIRNCEDISFQLGRLFQIQDDYIDCFGDETLTGKNGTDIQEGKCSWLAVNTLLRCNSKTRTVFISCYGSKEPAHIERIKQLYIQLKIPQLYKEEEREIYDDIIHKIGAISSSAERELFQKLLDMTYDRKK